MATASTGRISSHLRCVAVVCAAALAFGFGACGSSGSSSGNAATTLQKGIDEANAGNFDAAKKDFQKVLDEDPQNKYAYYNLGYIAQTEGDRAEAEKQYRLSIASDPAYGPALYNLGIEVAADGDKQGAIDLYRRAIAANALDAGAHFNLGLLLRETGKKVEGNSEVQTAVRLNPNLAASAKAQHIPIK